MDQSKHWTAASLPLKSAYQISIVASQLLINRGLVIRSFSYKNIRPRLDSLGFKPDTAFSCLVHSLLTPKPAAQHLIQTYASLFALPTVFSIGLQIRTGDSSMRTAEYDQQNTVERHEAFFTCAEQVAKRYALPSQKVVWYLISDSKVLKEDAMRVYGDKVVVSGLKVRHTDPLLKLDDEEGEPASERRKKAFDGAMDSVVESWTFAETDFKIITEQR